MNVQYGKKIKNVAQTVCQNQVWFNCCQHLNKKWQMQTKFTAPLTVKEWRR